MVSPPTRGSGARGSSRAGVLESMRQEMPNHPAASRGSLWLEASLLPVPSRLELTTWRGRCGAEPSPLRDPLLSRWWERRRTRPRAGWRVPF